ncbi:hypothetical protein CTI12_AA025580 [Artemisia annua]|uniref:Transmembrane protein n=1 Tax=Artemisia annua TaxID=35608 RepID=A0A2U1QHA2_ARTAN|nr:hypothetical protein CTI12_AA025580 [Artemisia annua]
MATISTVTTNFHRPKPLLQPNTQSLLKKRQAFSLKSKPCNNVRYNLSSSKTTFICSAIRRTSNAASDVPVTEMDDNVRKVTQFLLWAAEGVYIAWLFLLPNARGDPFWAISSETIDSLIGLSLNFFFVLPLMNSVGIRLMDAPVLHPMSEGFFNFVLGWTFMFAPLLFTDRKRDGYKGSLDVLWGFQMFLTNTFLIPYMAIRLSKPDTDSTPRKASQLESVMVNYASVVGVVGGAVCLISVLWALYGRSDGNFGDLAERWEFFASSVGSERFVYAFFWDICIYIVFQPWLIGQNLQNVEKMKVNLVKYMRFVPVFGLVAYLLCLDVDEDV